MREDQLTFCVSLLDTFHIGAGLCWVYHFIIFVSHQREGVFRCYEILLISGLFFIWRISLSMNVILVLLYRLFWVNVVVLEILHCKYSHFQYCSAYSNLPFKIPSFCSITSHYFLGPIFRLNDFVTITKIRMRCVSSKKMTDSA